MLEKFRKFGEFGIFGKFGEFGEFGKFREFGILRVYEVRQIGVLDFLIWLKNVFRLISVFFSSLKKYNLSNKISNSSIIGYLL